MAKLCFLGTYPTWVGGRFRKQRKLVSKCARATEDGASGCLPQTVWPWGHLKLSCSGRQPAMWQTGSQPLCQMSLRGCVPFLPLPGICSQSSICEMQVLALPPPQTWLLSSFLRSVGGEDFSKQCSGHLRAEFLVCGESLAVPMSKGLMPGGADSDFSLLRPWWALVLKGLEYRRWNGA